MAGVCLFMLEQVAALAQATARGQGAGPPQDRRRTGSRFGDGRAEQG
ncbi:hypothetical protein OIE52_03175 [Streptomyces canus]|nr:hypothetical protein [Streptomyces canus]